MCSATTWYVSSEKNASDSNAGTANRPLNSIAKAFSLAKPGDTMLFAPGTYPSLGLKVPDGAEDLPIILKSNGKGKAIFTNDGSKDILLIGSYNTVDGIEFRMTSEHPVGSGIEIADKQHVIIRNCRFYACQVGVNAHSTHYLSITNSEMAYSGALAIHITGSGGDEGGHLNPADVNKFVEVRNTYMHDAGWNVAEVAEGCIGGWLLAIVAERLSIPDKFPGEGLGAVPVGRRSACSRPERGSQFDNSDLLLRYGPSCYSYYFAGRPDLEKTAFDDKRHGRGSGGRARKDGGRRVSLRARQGGNIHPADV